MTTPEERQFVIERLLEDIIDCFDPENGGSSYYVELINGEEHLVSSKVALLLDKSIEVLYGYDDEDMQEV